MSKPHFTGIVKWFNTEKGYGFISCNETATDVFVHHSALGPEFRNRNTRLKELPENTRVQFTMKRTDRGDQAADVTAL